MFLIYLNLLFIVVFTVVSLRFCYIFFLLLLLFEAKIAIFFNLSIFLGVVLNLFAVLLKFLKFIFFFCKFAISIFFSNYFLFVSIYLKITAN